MLALSWVSFHLTSLENGTLACGSDTASVVGPFSFGLKPQSTILQKDMQLVAILCQIIFRLFFVAVLVLWVATKSFPNSCCCCCLPQCCQNVLAC